MYLFAKKHKDWEDSGIVKHWAGQIRFRYRWPIVLDALKYLRYAIRGIHIAGLQPDGGTPPEQGMPIS